MPLPRSILAGLVCLFLLAISACSSSPTPESALKDANKSNIQRLANLYAKFQFENKFKGPKDEAEFKKFLSGSGAAFLQTIGVNSSDTDGLFVSERDGEPFQIRYGIVGGPRGCQEAAIFEKTGKNGKRLVGFLNMVQREVDELEYETLFKAKSAPK